MTLLNKQIVIVFINGFGVQADWKPFDYSLLPENVRMINVTPSSTGSLHDRCCHIFYELKGGRVNFGKDHAKFHGHSQYGEYFERGLYPEWNEENPVILIGHSMGGLTALAMQKYLEDQKIEDLPYKTSANWISGIITLSTPLSGALRVYALGMHSYQIPMIEIGSIGYVCGLLVHFVEYFNSDFLRKYFWASGHRHWHMSYFNPKARLLSLLVWFLSTCGYGIHTNSDNLAFDCTLQGLKLWNNYFEMFPNSFYFSLVANVRGEDRKLNQPISTDRLEIAELSDDEDNEDNEDERSIRTEDIHFTYPSNKIVDTIQLKKSPLHEKRRFHFFHFILNQMMAITQELEKMPSKVADVNTSSWMDEGHDGLLTVSSQKFPKFRDQLFPYEYINSWKSMKFSSSRSGNDTPEQLKQKIWQSGKWYVSAVKTCHLGPLFHCSKTWKILWKMVYIIASNQHKMNKNKGIDSSIQRSNSLPKDMFSSSHNHHHHHHHHQHKEKHHHHEVYPDQQLPHFHFRYHYHHHYNYHHHYHGVIAHFLKCSKSNMISIGFLTVVITMVCYYYQINILNLLTSSFTLSSVSSYSLTSIVLLFSHLLLLFINIPFFYFSHSDIDYIEKMILSFTFYRLALFYSIAFHSITNNYNTDNNNNYELINHFYFISSWQFFNQLMENYLIYFLSDSNANSHYHHSHNIKNNNIYKFLSFPKIFVSLLLFLFAHLLLQQQEQEQQLQQSRPEQPEGLASMMFPPADELSSEVNYSMILPYLGKALLAYTFLSGLSPLLWQFIFTFKKSFDHSSFSSSSSSSSSSHSKKMKEDEEDPSNHHHRHHHHGHSSCPADDIIPMNQPQVRICWTVISSHLVHHFFWCIMFFFHLRFLWNFAAPSSSSSSPSSSSSLESSESTMFNPMYFILSAIAFVQKWVWLLSFSVGIYVVLFYNYLNLCNNLQFTLIKLQFWPRYLAQRLLNHDNHVY